MYVIFCASSAKWDGGAVAHGNLSSMLFISMLLVDIDVIFTCSVVLGVGRELYSDHCSNCSLWLSQNQVFHAVWFLKDLNINIVFH